MKVLILLGWIGLAWCCTPEPGAVNIATNGEASQSSDYAARGITGYARRAIDGVKDLDWYKGYCTHTNAEANAWWKLDMKKKYKINTVIVNGRSDCCLERLKNAELRIGDSPDNNNPVCGKITDVSTATTTYCCNGMEGQYISVVLPGSQFLSLCEVEVYGEVYEEPVKNTVCW